MHNHITIDRTQEEEEAAEEAEWVCCDTCEVWRELPPGCDVAALPEAWFCGMEPLPLSLCAIENTTIETPGNGH